MSTYNLSAEEQKRLEQAGVDYDLDTCLEYNPQSFEVSEIKKVLAVWTGENDGDDWRWIIQLNNTKHGGRFVFLQGGCDYTGWDCQSWAKSSFANTALQAAKFAETGPEGTTVQDVTGAGLGHMLNVLSGEYGKEFNAVYKDLVRQIKEGKSKTWREEKDEEFNLNLPKITK